MKNLTLKIHGQVQGVNFRFGVKQKADELGLVGWVRNDKGGCVSVVVEGEEDKLDELKEYCNEGPRLSMVEDMKEKGFFIKRLSFNKFEIKY